MSRGTPPTQIRIPEDLKERARQRASEEGLDLSKVVVGLLDLWDRELVTLPPPLTGQR